MKKTKTRILEDMLISREKIKTESNSLRVENTAEGLQSSITCIESNKIEQETREGYNKCNFPYTENNKFSVTATVDDYHITTNYFVELEAGKTYHCSWECDGNEGSQEGTDTVQVYLLKDKTYTSYFNISKSQDITITDGGTYYIRFDVNKNGITHSFWNLQITEGIEERTYEQYGAMPSIEYPSPVEGVTEDVKLRVQNKNLAYLYNSNGFKNHTDGVWIGNSNYNCFIARVKPNTTYYAQNIHSNLCYFDKNMNFLKGLGFGEARKFNTNDLDNVCYVTVAVEKEQSNKVMIEENSEPTDFVEHKEQEFTISLENKALYKGDKLVYLNKNNPNATEGAGWYEYNKMLKYVFDGSETWKLTNAQPNNKDWHAFYPSKIVNKYSDGVRGEDICFSNYYQNTNNEDMSSVTIINDAISNIVLTNPVTSGQIMFVSQNSTVEEMKAECKKLYDEGNPLYVVYTLQEPTYKPVTDEKLIKQLDAILLYMSEYEELTNFDFNNDIIFEITVEKDRLSILENKLDNIEQNTTSATMLALESEV